MKLHKSALVGASTLATTFVSFLLLARYADQAMDKTGIGDLDAWKMYSTWAGFAFWLTIAIWLLLIGVSLVRKCSERSQLLSVCGLSLFLAPAIWAVVVFVA